MELYAVDRAEGEWIVLQKDDKSVLRVLAADLPAGLISGDVLTRDNQGAFHFLPEETKRRKKELFSLQKQLFENS